MYFESDFAKRFDNLKTIIAETNFKNYIIQFLVIAKTALWLTLENLDENSKGLCYK